MLDLQVTYKVTHNGTDITSHVISYSRQASICEGEEKLSLVVDSGNYNTFDEIDIYENGSRVKRYYINSIYRNVLTDTITIEASDIKKVRDYFIADTYIVDYPSTSRYWIQKFADEAGVNVTFTTSDSGGYLSNNTTLGMVSFYDQIQTLLQVAGWYMKTDDAGNLVIGDLEVSRSPSVEITTHSKFHRRKFDKSLRNRVVVWGSANPERKRWVFADIKTSTPWNLVDRTVVVANSNIPNMYSAYGIANKVLKEFDKLDDIVEITVPAVSRLELGDSAYINIDDYRGILLLTSFTKTVNANGGAIETLVFNERCPRLFAYWGWEIDYIYVATDKGIYRKPMITQSGQIYDWVDFNSGIPADDRITLKVQVHNGLFGTVTSGGNAYYRDIMGWGWYPITLSGNAIDIGVERNAIYIGEDNEVVEKFQFSSPEVIFSGEQITSVDSLDITAFTTISGEIGYFYNEPVSEYTGGDQEVDPLIYSTKSPSSLSMNLFYGFDTENTTNIVNTGEFIISGEYYEIRKDNLNIYRYDRDTDNLELIFTLDSGYYYKFSLLDEYSLIIVEYSSSEVILISLNVFSKSYVSSVIFNDSNYIVEDTDLVVADNVIGVLIVAKNTSTNYPKLYLYKKEKGHFGYLHEVYEINEVADVTIKTKGIYEDKFLFLALYEKSYNPGNCEDYCNIIIGSDLSVHTANNYGQSSVSGVDKKNAIFYYSDRRKYGNKVSFFDFSILEDGLLDDLHSGNAGEMFFAEDGALLYLIETEFDSYKITNIQDVSNNINYGEYDVGNSWGLGVDSGYLVVYDNDSGEIKEINLLFKDISKVIKLEKAPNIHNSNNKNIFISGSIIWYKDLDNNYRTLFSGDGKYVDNYLLNVYLIKQDSVDKLLDTITGYRVSLGKSSLYLYQKYPSPTELGSPYKDSITFLNNGTNLVTMPKEGEIVSSGNNRNIFSISSNTSNITVFPISGIINNETYIGYSGLIDVPISGNILEVSNYIIKDEDTVSKIVFSNGIDKIYENYGGTDFQDVTNNLIDDFGVTQIYWIAIDDDF